MEPEIIGCEEKNENLNEDLIQNEIYFPTSVYTTNKPEFLNDVLEISNIYLKKNKRKHELDEIYPVVMTQNFYDHPRVEEFAAYVGHTAWNILDSEGYDMRFYELRFSEMWTQEHHKHSLMEHHVHGHGAQISGFYFLETPENCSQVIIHDPRPGKVQINLPQKDMQNVTSASHMITYKPTPGLLMFVPPWLPHSFGRHASDKSLKFVHFNMFPVFNPNMEQAEVI